MNNFGALLTPKDKFEELLKQPRPVVKEVQKTELKQLVPFLLIPKEKQNVSI